MKISNRIPSIGNQAPAENDVPIQPNKTRVQDKFEGPDSITRTRDQIESRVDKFEVPNPVLTNYYDLPPIPDNVVNIANNAESIASQIGPSVNLPSNQNTAQIERGSRVDEYKGPDSLKPQEIESPVNQYKGPKSILEEPKIESRVNKYKGPDSLITNNIDVPPIPDEVRDIINNRTALASHFGESLKGPLGRTEDSTESQTPSIESRAEKYKGPKTVLKSE